ncbi:annexin-like protein RJ4 [Dendrobium catenatum]|nr:annexin-like protein RJ4 [Dendrobium catenatum]
MATLRVPLHVPSAVEDAKNLWMACEEREADEKTLIDILAHRDEAQRLQIIQSYEDHYNGNLIDRLEYELSGEFKEALYCWMFNHVQRGAIIANMAMWKWLDYRAIVETACINSTKELLEVKQAYHDLFKRSLEEDVAKMTNGDLRKLLVGLVSTYRYDGKEIVKSLALYEANILHDVIRKKLFNHDEVIRIFTTRSKAQLIATFNKYKDEFGISILKDLSSGSPDLFPSVLKIIIRSIISPHKYFQKLLRLALNGEVTDENVLARIIVTRAEKDLQEIKDMYEERGKMSLIAAINNKTSGHFKNFILELIGN